MVIRRSSATTRGFDRPDGSEENVSVRKTGKEPNGRSSTTPRRQNLSDTSLLKHSDSEASDESVSIYKTAMRTPRVRLSSDVSRTEQSIMSEESVPVPRTIVPAPRGRASGSKQEEQSMKSGENGKSEKFLEKPRGRTSSLPRVQEVSSSSDENEDRGRKAKDTERSARSGSRRSRSSSRPRKSKLSEATEARIAERIKETSRPNPRSSIPVRRSDESDSESETEGSSTLHKKEKMPTRNRLSSLAKSDASMSEVTEGSATVRTKDTARSRSRSLSRPRKSDRSLATEISATSQGKDSKPPRSRSSSRPRKSDMSHATGGSVSVHTNDAKPPRARSASLPRKSGTAERMDDNSSLNAFVQHAGMKVPPVMDSDNIIQPPFKPLPPLYWAELENLKFNYPGWERDYTQACEFYHLGDEQGFVKAFRKLRDKQRVYDDYKAYSRLNELAALELTYPGAENDKQDLEMWHLKNPSNDITDGIFHEKLVGLKNKQDLFYGDRSHPNIMSLDGLELSYPGWEEDYQEAVAAHCEGSDKKFASMFHRLQEKQHINNADRSHWRLAALDRLAATLTYPGWKKDVEAVEKWHVESIDSDKNDRMFAEVLEGMKDQQQIFLGWNHQADDDDASNDGSQAASATDESVEVQGDFYGLQLKDANNLKKVYDSINESLQMHQGKKKQIIEERSSPAVSRSGTPINRRDPSPTARDGSMSYRGRASPASPQRGDSPVSSSPFPHQRQPSPTSRGRTASFHSRTSSNGRDRRSPSPAGTSVGSNGRLPPKQIKFGNCVVCLTRAKTHVFVPCGHLCACAACSTESMGSNQCCPICRQHADSSYRVFMT